MVFDDAYIFEVIDVVILIQVPSNLFLKPYHVLA